MGRDFNNSSRGNRGSNYNRSYNNNDRNGSSNNQYGRNNRSNNDQPERRENYRGRYDKQGFKSGGGRDDRDTRTKNDLDKKLDSFLSTDRQAKEKLKKERLDQQLEDYLKRSKQEENNEASNKQSTPAANANNESGEANKEL